MKHLNTELIRPGDILQVTSMQPSAIAIKLRTWPRHSPFDMSLPTHSALVCDRGGGLYYASEMKPTGGPDMTELWRYDRSPRSWLPHVCCVLRHPLLVDGTDAYDLRQRLNARMIELHGFKVRYGFDKLLRFLFPHVKDDPYTQICSQWIIEAFRYVGIPTPWDEGMRAASEPLLVKGAAAPTLPLVSPADLQRWHVLNMVEGAVV